jgi:hypothetical protein
MKNKLKIEYNWNKTNPRIPTIKEIDFNLFHSVFAGSSFRNRKGANNKAISPMNEPKE